MGNLPISAHITVVSTTPSTLSDAGTAPPAGGAAAADGADFSSLLAGQIAAKLESPVSGKADSVQPEPVRDEAGSLPANDPAASAGVAVLGFIPLSSLPLAAEMKESGEQAELPANFAAQPSALPEKGLGESVREELLSGERAFKPSARPEVSDIGAAGLFAHGVVAAKGETGPVGQPIQTSAVAVESRLGSAGWGTELGQKVVWLANQQQQVAHINVTPPQLGPIEIRLDLASDQASAVFVSPHAAVRDAIEAALPRLREMLAEAGVTLGNVDVSAHSFGHPRQENPQAGDKSRSLVPEFAAVHSGMGTLAGMARDGRGLVDIFA